MSDSHVAKMEATVCGQETVSFYCKVSSESGFDWLEFYIDQERQDRISGTGGDWAYKSYNLSAGNHVLKWRYVKDSSCDSGSDCGWVDYVQWNPPEPEPDPLPQPTEWASLVYTYDSAGRRVAKDYDEVTAVSYTHLTLPTN